MTAPAMAAFITRPMSWPVSAPLVMPGFGLDLARGMAE
jgi:hypothetical protein